jgi:hypothetical protein
VDADALKPRWTSASYLLYVGGLTVLLAAMYSLGYLSRSYGKAAYVFWALLIVVVLKVIALFFRRKGRWMTAGLFAFATVIAYAVLIGALENWFGWLPHSFSFLGGFHVWLFVLELLTIVAALASIAFYRFPLISSIVAVVGWLFIADVLSNGGNWGAVVTLLVGLFYLLVGMGLDHTSRKAYGFWFQVVSGLLIGGSLLYFWHSGDTGWWLVFVVGLVYIGVARGTSRSSWAVLGSFGIFAAAVHFGEKWARTTISVLGASATSQREWVPPIVLAAVGFLFVLLGLRIERRPPAEPTAPVPSPVPPAPAAVAAE